MKKPLFLLLSALCAAAPLSYAAPQTATQQALPEVIARPAAKSKASAYVKAAADIQSKLANQKLPATLTRNKEVVVVALPCSRIFAANSDTLMLDDADALLHNLLPYAKQPQRLQIVVAVHSDNTGSEEYQLQLTTNRANYICGEIADKCQLGNANNLVPVGLGHSCPLADDESIGNRSRNRRVEIYIVPVF